jgi:methionyl-tRNA synthetase
MPERFYICTAIDYTNGAPHIGHAYEKVLADVMARYRRLKGEEVFFLTGVDQHGQKVQQSAEKKGVPPRNSWRRTPPGSARSGRNSASPMTAGRRRWSRSTRTVCSRSCSGSGTSRRSIRIKQAGYYSVRQEQFLTDKERGEDGEFGPEWGQVEFREEEKLLLSD